MANPNIVAVATINGNNASLAVTSTAQSLVSNSAASGKIYKINQIYVSNVDTAAADEVIVTLRDDVTGTPVTRHIAKNISIPAKATLEVLSAPFYIKEDQDIQITGVAASGDLEAVATWEEIS
jgi:hypothetical protein